MSSTSSNTLEQSSFDFVCGMAAGAVGLVVGHPLDTIKVRIQTNYIQNPTAFKVLSKSIKKDGLLSLYRGIMAPIAGIGFVNAIQFTTYEFAKRELLSHNIGRLENSEKRLSIGGTFIAGIFSGFFAAAVMSPFDLIKVKQQSVVKHKLSTVQTVVNIVKSEGMYGLSRGLFPTLLRDCPTMGLYFGVYESCCRYFSKGDTLYQEQHGYCDYAILIGGGAGGMCCWLFAYPVDVIKSQMQYESSSRRLRFLEVVAALYKKGGNGYSLFVRGLGICVFRAMPVNMSIFFTYELLQKK